MISDLSAYAENGAAGPAAAATDARPFPGSLASVIGRVEETIEAETTALRSNPAFDLKASNARKSRCLYELNKVVRATRPEDIGAEHRAGMQRLRDKLKANEAAIVAHLNAVNEVAGLLQNAIQRSEADGTYSAHEFGGTDRE